MLNIRLWLRRSHLAAAIVAVLPRLSLSLSLSLSFSLSGCAEDLLLGETRPGGNVDDGTGDDGWDGSGGGTKSRIQLPELKGDCLSYFSNDGSRAPVNLADLGLQAGNCSEFGRLCVLVKSTTPRDFATLMFNIPIDEFESGTPVDLAAEPEASLANLLLHVHNMTYDLGSRGRLPRGTVVATAFDLEEGAIDIRFTSVALGGEDAVYAGDLHCSIDGVLSIRGISRKALNEACNTDRECGGDFSGRVCGDDFVCIRGCYDDDACPLGSLCESNGCVEDAGAGSEAVEICQEACHERTFFRCNEDEAKCNEACASRVRASVSAFITCNEYNRGVCSAECEAKLGL